MVRRRQLSSGYLRGLRFVVRLILLLGGNQRVQLVFFSYKHVRRVSLRLETRLRWGVWLGRHIC
jgi:hypothetical protein